MNISCFLSAVDHVKTHWAYCIFTDYLNQYAVFDYEMFLIQF